MKKNGKHISIVPTTTVSPARLQMCQPTQRPVYKTGEWVITSWGRCRISGRFGQRHQDLLDAFMWNAEKKRITDDGGMEILVDPAKVRKTMSSAGYSLTGIEKLIKELREITLELKTPKFNVMGGLLDHVVDSEKTRPDPLHGGTRPLWRVRLGLAFAELLAYDAPLYYDPAPVASLQHGITQAVARHILSHSAIPNSGWDMDALIKAVAGEMSSVAIRHRRREIRGDSEGLAVLGINISEENRMTYI
jgi:hypothetical protein